MSKKRSGQSENKDAMCQSVSKVEFGVYIFHIQSIISVLKRVLFAKGFFCDEIAVKTCYTLLTFREKEKRLSIKRRKYAVKMI